MKKLSYICVVIKGTIYTNVVSEDEFARITQSMNSGEEVSYTLILANVNKKGLQKVEFTIKSINRYNLIPLRPLSIFLSYRPSATSPTSLSVWRCFILSKS